MYGCKWCYLVGVGGGDQVWVRKEECSVSCAVSRVAGWRWEWMTVMLFLGAGAAPGMDKGKQA